MTFHRHSLRVFILLLVLSGFSTSISAQFTDIGAGLTGVSECSSAWGDYDNDGDLDLALAGHTGSEYISKIYRNDSGFFTDIGAGLTGVTWCSLAWGDYDNDGDLDLAVTGAYGPGVTSKIYRNDSGSFTDIGAGLVGVANSSLAWGDYDNDGDLDLAVAGYTGSTRSSNIYRNDSGVFTDSGNSLPGVDCGSLAWGDYDNDGDLDLALAGDVLGAGSISKIYRNDSGSFTDIGASLTGVGVFSCVAWGDYDSDGDLDLALAGYADGIGSISKIYRNNSGTFTDIGAALPGVEHCKLAWGDYDNDGDFDLALVGLGGGYGYISKIYKNVLGSFVDVGADLQGVADCSLTWGNYDNDGDLDLALAGFTPSGYVSKVYRNDITSVNTPPSPPSGLTVITSDSDVTFFWSAASDAQTPQAGLTYNLRVGTTPGGCDVFSGMASPTTGKRQIPAMGNVGHRRSWTVKGLTPDTKDYYWSVQTIDAGYAGSAWAPLNAVGKLPLNVSLSPASGTIPVCTKQIISTTYLDPNGRADLHGCYLIINTTLSEANGIYLCYSQNLNKLYLRNDANTSWGTGYTPGSSAVLQNSQCKVYCAETTVISSGNQIQVNWKVEIKLSMAGKDVNGWMLAIDDEGLRDDWDQMASCSILAFPQTISLVPNRGNYNIGTKYTFQSNYRHPCGYSSLKGCYFLINGIVSGAGGIFLCYSQNTGKLYLRDDTNTSWGTGYAPGSSAVLENRRVKLYCQESSVTGSGTDLIVNWRLNFKPSLLGATFFCLMYATDDQDLKDGWDEMGYFSFDYIGN